MQFKKFQNMSEVAIGGGGGLKTSDKVWSFRLFFNPSLTYLLLGPSLMTYFLPRGPKSNFFFFYYQATYVSDRQ